MTCMTCNIFSIDRQTRNIGVSVSGRECVSFLIKRLFWWVFRLCTRLVLGSIQIQQLHSICSQKFVLGGEGTKSSRGEFTYASLVLHVASHFTREGRSLITCHQLYRNFIYSHHRYPRTKQLLVVSHNLLKALVCQNAALDWSCTMQLL